MPPAPPILSDRLFNCELPKMNKSILLILIKNRNNSTIADLSHLWPRDRSMTTNTECAV